MSRYPVRGNDPATSDDTEPPAEVPAAPEIPTAPAGPPTAAGVPAAPRRALPGPVRAWAGWLFPAVVVVGMLLLTGLQLSGSSIAALSPNPKADPGLILGQPRSIRSDEWLLTSPAAIGNDRRGLPTQTWVGLTDTFLPASGLGVPSRHWSELFHPGDWGFFVAPTAVAFAWRWWVPLTAGLLGGYALLFQLTRRPLLSSALAAVIALSPYSAWWSDSPAAVVGFLCAAGACMLVGFRQRRLLTAVVWGLLGGYFATVAGLIMYPPWLVSVGLVLLAVLVGYALDRRVGWARFGLVSGAALVVFVPSLMEWAREALPSLTAMSGTIYPGNRVSVAGGGSLRWMLNALSSPWWSYSPGGHLLTVAGQETAVNGARLFTNVSEASATWLPLPLLPAAVIAALWSRRFLRDTTPDAARTGAGAGSGTAAPAGEPASGPAGDERPLRWTVGLLGAVLVLLLAWALLPLPGWVGTITLLNRVPGYRTPLALGLGTAVLLAIGGAAVGRGRLRSWFVAVVVGTAVLAGAAMAWATVSLPWRGGHPSLRSVLLLAVLAAGGFGLLLLGPRLRAAGAVVVGLLAVAVYAPVNPVYQGLGALSRDPVVKTLRPYVSAGHSPKVAVYGQDTRLNALVVASGVQSLSGLTVYPDRAFWERVDPGQETVWNNYSKYYWRADPSLTSPRIEPYSGTQRILRINPCAASTRELGIELSVSDQPLTQAPCLQFVTRISRPGAAAYLYRSGS